MQYSFIIPVYNRPDEVEELLESLTQQTLRDFEVIIVEDGSQVTCQAVAERYSASLNVKYVLQQNAGPGQARNTGAERAQAEWLIILDSDCVLPPGYLEAVDNELKERPCDAFGGPDRAHDSFTPVQKAINYSMTSFLTTGGIRGGKKKLDKFYPRSFNMGIRRELYHNLGGFSSMRFGEDIDLSIRIFESGAQCRLFPEAWVWHKRRTDFRKFFRQVHNSGIARINLHKRHPGSMKLVHTLPAVFTVGNAALIVLACLCGTWWLGPIVIYCLAVCVHSAALNHSLWVGLLSVPASYIQLVGYGTGFIRAWWQRCVMGRGGDVQAFRNTFYK